MDISRLAGSFLGVVKQVAVDLLEKKDDSGKPAVLDVLPDVVNTGLQALGAPELPPIDHELAMGGLQDLVALLTSQNDQARFDAAKGLAGKLLPVISQAAAEELGKKAGDHFVADVAQGLIKWVNNNPSQAFALGADVVRVISTAVATGGVSLAADLPALMPQLTAMAAGVLKEAGIPVDKLIQGMVTDLLKTLGVEAATAEQIGKVVGPLAALGADVALAVATQGKHTISPELVRSAVGAVAQAAGVSPDVAAVVATAAGMAATLGQNFAGHVLSGQSAQSFMGLDKLTLKVEDVAQDAVKLLMGQQGASTEQISKKLLELGPLFSAFAQTFEHNTTELNVDNSRKGWVALNEQFRSWMPGLGPMFDQINQQYTAAG